MKEKEWDKNMVRKSGKKTESDDNFENYFG